MLTPLHGPTARVDAVVDGLGTDGVVIVEEALAPAVLEAARAALDALLPETPTGRNAFEGFRTRRVYSALGKTRALDPLALHPLVLGASDRVLRHHWISATVGISIEPGEQAQLVHHDDAIYPLPQPHPDVMVSAMWALDDFTAANGATVLFPGTHRSAEPPRPVTRPVAAAMQAGSVAIYLGTLWHGGGANTTDRRRLGVTFEYLAGWLRQQENQVLVLPPERAAEVPERLQELLGYAVFPPFMGYVDGRSPLRLIPGRERDR
ncbi:MAG: phytanoyl-CoA dioxygenase family protein [Acidimicrobiales bacterium]|nr:phytanoyl-CoA dioxygenase family protein [Acidimicrobiales bacterium]